MRARRNFGQIFAHVHLTVHHMHMATTNLSQLLLGSGVDLGNNEDR